MIRQTAQEDNAMNFKKPADRLFLEALQRSRGIVEKADVIFGIHQRGRSVLYGRKRLEAVIASGNHETLTQMFIEYDSDPDSDQLEILCAFLNVVKDRNEYEASKDKFLGDGQHRWGGWNR